MSSQGCADIREPGGTLQCHPQGSHGKLAQRELCSLGCWQRVLMHFQRKPARALCRANPAQRSCLSSLEKKKKQKNNNNLPKYLFAAAVKGVYFPSAEFPNIFCWELIGPCSFALKQNNLEGALQALGAAPETQPHLFTFLLRIYSIFSAFITLSSFQLRQLLCQRVCESVMIKKGIFSVLALGSCP